jgi:hypothetical protein
MDLWPIEFHLEQEKRIASHFKAGAQLYCSTARKKIRDQWIHWQKVPLQIKVKDPHKIVLPPLGH